MWLDNHVIYHGKINYCFQNGVKFSKIYQTRNVSEVATREEALDPSLTIQEEPPAKIKLQSDDMEEDVWETTHNCVDYQIVDYLHTFTQHHPQCLSL